MLLVPYFNFMHIDSLKITKKRLCHFDNKLTVELVDNCNNIITAKHIDTKFVVYIDL